MAQDKKEKAPIAKKNKAPSLKSPKVTLRVLGTKVTLLEPLRKAAEKDLNIRLEYIPKDGTDAQSTAALSPESFDIYDQWFHDIDMIWPTSSLQAIDVNRINSCNKISKLPHITKKRFGQLVPEISLGSIPLKRLYVQYNDELGEAESEKISLLPTVHNADSFAVINGKGNQKIDSWSSLPQEKAGYGIGLQYDASIGALDAIMSFKS